MFPKLASIKKLLFRSAGDFFASHESFSQCGEDRIVALLFHAIGIASPTYLDIGANDPVIFNNTYLFYRAGCDGVCVEANPDIVKRLRQTRPRDICINAAVSSRVDGSMPLHIFDEGASGLSTLSTDWMQQRVNRGFHVDKTLSVPTRDINSLIESHFATVPHFLSIDIEGLELDVLTSLDFNRFAPSVICVETFRQSTDNASVKDTRLMRYIEDKGYVLFADTYINTIYIQATKFPAL